MRSARNLVLVIGDGMGVSTVTAARIFAGQQRGMAGEEHKLSFEHFPHVGLVKTYNTNQQVPDSAGTSTALHTGVKTRAGLIALGPGSRRGQCGGGNDEELDSLLDLAEDRGIATGIVTNTRITHATIATLYAHSPEREWESDAVMPLDAQLIGCVDIASQLVNYRRGNGIDVVFGGGRAAFTSRAVGGERAAQGADLLSRWISGGAARTFVDTAKGMSGLASSGQVMGLFAASHLAYDSERKPGGVEPGLPEMAVKALELLEQKGTGYVLVVEGGRIDHAHHEGKAGYALEETVVLADTIAQILERVDLAETLVVVTADHSHTLTMGGYPTRGNPILGLVVENDASGRPMRRPALAADGKPYTTLSYYSGPGALPGYRTVPGEERGAIYPALVPTQIEMSGQAAQPFGTHGGEDVALYAQGAGASWFGGVMEQEEVFHRIVAAMGWE